jgi:hypothetical protein
MLQSHCVEWTNLSSGVLGAIVGSIVGSAIGVLGSLYVNRRDYRRRQVGEGRALLAELIWNYRGTQLLAKHLADGAALRWMRFDPDLYYMYGSRSAHLLSQLLTWAELDKVMEGYRLMDLALDQIGRAISAISADGAPDTTAIGNCLESRATRCGRLAMALHTRPES